MSESRPTKPKTPLAVALVQGMGAFARSRYNVVPKMTAYRWAEEPAVRATVGSTGSPGVRGLATKAAPALGSRAKFFKNLTSTDIH
jgi:hypothetical protein